MGRGIVSRWGARVLVLAGIGLLAGCSCGFQMANRLDSAPRVRFVASPLVNETNAVAVDVVLVYDGDLVDPLKELSARDWFATRAQLRRDFPNEQRTYEAVSLELVPGQDLTLPLPRMHCARQVLFFADYANPDSPHRQMYTPARALAVGLDERDFSVCDAEVERVAVGRKQTEERLLGACLPADRAATDLP